MKRNVALIVVGIAALVGLGLVVFGANGLNTNKNASTSTASNQPSGGNNTAKYTAADVAKHNSQGDCWTIVNGSVYDITDFTSKHPGGKEILQACGKDATEIFNGMSSSVRSRAHSAEAANILNQYKIGVLE